MISIPKVKVAIAGVGNCASALIQGLEYYKIDAMRATKVALDRKISGPLNSISAYCFKHPPIQMPYERAKHEFLEFIDGKRAR